MTKYLLLIIFVISTSCGQSVDSNQQASDEPVYTSTNVTDNNTDTLKINAPEKVNNENVDYWLKELSSEFKNYRIISLKEPIIADLNGDGIADKAIFTFQNGKSGIIITDGNTQQQVKIGLGNTFEEMGDDFSWVDYWGVVKDSITYEVIIIDSEIIGDAIVLLENPSIVVRKEEVGGGIITFRDGKYEWIHQSD